MDKLVGTVVVTLGVVAIVAAASIALPWAANDLAAWVQAIGSVAAIFWAARIARRQGEDAQRAIVDQHRLHLTGLGAMLGQLLLPLYAADSAFKNTAASGRFDAAQNVVQGLQDAVNAAQRIPFHEIPYAYVATLGLGFNRQLEMALSLVWEVADGRSTNERFAAAVIAIGECCTRAEYFLSRIENAAVTGDGNMMPISLG